MQLGARIVGAMLATLALCAAVDAQELAERDFLDGSEAVDSLIQPTRPTLPPVPYEPPLETFYVSLDMVGFTRPHAGGIFGVVRNGPIALSGSDLDFATQPGLRALLGVRLNEYFAVEGSYLGLFDWNESGSAKNTATNTLGSSGNLLAPFSGFGQPQTSGLDFNNFISVNNETLFNGAEVNFRRRIDLPYSLAQTSFLFGTRYFSVKDRFQYRSRSVEPVAPGTANFAEVDTSNRMFGPQVGGALELHVAPRGWLNLETKGAMLFSEADQSTQFTTGPLVGAGTTIAGSRSDQRVSFAADFQATLSWKFTSAFVGRVGYQAIFIEGLALGSENFMANARNAAVDPSQLVKDGNIVFHGPFAGMTFTW